MTHGHVCGHARQRRSPPVAKHMARKRYGCAVVIERGRVAGIFTATDALRFIAAMVPPTVAPAGAHDHPPRERVSPHDHDTTEETSHDHARSHRTGARTRRGRRDRSRRGARAAPGSIVRHGDLGDSPLVRALFAVRTLPDRIAGHKAGPTRRSVSTTCIVDATRARLPDPRRRRGTRGRGRRDRQGVAPRDPVRPRGEMPTRSAPSRSRASSRWRGRSASRPSASTTRASRSRCASTRPTPTRGRKFRRYFTVIGPGSHFIRRSMLASLARRFGTPGSREESADAARRRAPRRTPRRRSPTASPSPRAPDAIWPWLVQMGVPPRRVLQHRCARQRRRAQRARDPSRAPAPAGRRRHARDARTATTASRCSRSKPERALVLGGLYDADAKRQRAFDAPRPEHYWQVTWSFVLEPLDGDDDAPPRARARRLPARADASTPSGSAPCTT